MKFPITELVEYAKVVRLLYTDGTISKRESKGWMDEVNCELNSLSKNKMEFSFFDGMYDTQITIKDDIITINSNS